jgi:ferredoxin--NADP+ reductase
MVEDKLATLTYVELIKEDLAVFRLVPKDQPVPDFKAGQFITIGFPGNDGKVIRRAYSIASAPENKDFIELVIRWVKRPLPGRLTSKLFESKEGDDVMWLNPAGNALLINETLPNGEKDNRRIVCIGGGTGIAPFVSFAEHLHATNDKREIVILHGASYLDELLYQGVFSDLQDESRKRGKSQWNFTYKASISRPNEWFNRSWGGQVGRVETFLKKGSDGVSPLEKLIGDNVTPENTIFYVCGWQGTINAVMEFLKPLGFVTEREKRADGTFDIKFESYG